MKDPKSTPLPPSLQEFITKAQRLSSPHDPSKNWDLGNVEGIELDKQLVEGMKPKKIYEVF